jgi:hypothetical protein
MFMKGEMAMKQRDVILGQVYAVKVSGRIQPVRVVAESPYGGWIGRNEQSDHEIRIRSGRQAARTPGKARRPMATGAEPPPGDSAT